MLVGWSCFGVARARGGSVNTVVPLRRKREPAYTPLDPPSRCQTPGHEGREARRYPGGRLCPDCLPAGPARKPAATREDQTPEETR